MTNDTAAQNRPGRPGEMPARGARNNKGIKGESTPAAKPIPFRDAPLGAPVVYRERMDSGEIREVLLERIECPVLSARFPAPYVPCLTRRRVQGEPGADYPRYDTGPHETRWVTDGRLPVLPAAMATHRVISGADPDHAARLALSRLVAQSEMRRQAQREALGKLSDEEIDLLGLRALSQALDIP